LLQGIDATRDSLVSLSCNVQVRYTWLICGPVNFPQGERRPRRVQRRSNDVVECDLFRPLLVLAIASFALMGCAVTSGNTVTPDGTVTTMIATTGSGPAGAGNEALLKGELTIIDGCVTIDRSSVPVSPNNATWDGATLKWEGVDYVLGDIIALSGGEADVAGDLPAGCKSLTAFYVSGTAE
jgi:hypothetical protein